MDKKEIKALLTLAKQNREIRKKNEDLLLGKSHYEEKLAEFHKPVTSTLEAVPFEDTRKDLKAIEDAIHNMTIPSTLPQLESTSISEPQQYRVDDLDEGLNVSYLEQNNFLLPSKLVNKPDEINEMLERVQRRSKSLGALKSAATKNLRKATKESTKKALEEEIIMYEDNLQLFKDYREKLKVLKTGARLFTITGEGLLTELDKLTDKLLGGSKTVYNKIVDILDLLLKDGSVTNEQVKDYYNKFLIPNK